MTDPARTRTIAWSDPMLTARAVAGKSGLEFLRAIISGEIPPPSIAATLSFALVHAEEGLVRFAGTPDDSMYNPLGTVHGGYACTLLDSAMGSAVMSLLDTTEAYTTADLTVHLVRPISAKTGLVTAEARIVHRGRKLATAEGKLTDQAGKLLAHASTTCLIFSRDG